MPFEFTVRATCVSHEVHIPIAPRKIHHIEPIHNVKGSPSVIMVQVQFPPQFSHAKCTIVSVARRHRLNHSAALHVYKLRFCFVRRHGMTETIVFQTIDDISLQVPCSLEADTFPTRAYRG